MKTILKISNPPLHRGKITKLILTTLLSLVLAGHARAQAPALTSTTFYGGAGDQRGTAIAVGGSALYVSGNVQPETQSPSDTGLVLKYARLSLSWNTSYRNRQRSGSVVFKVTGT